MGEKKTDFLRWRLEGGNPHYSWHLDSWEYDALQSECLRM